MAAAVIIATTACGASKKAAAPVVTTTSSTVPATTTTSTSLLPSGFGLFRNTKDHFSIAVPTSWHQIDPTSATASQVFSQLVQNNPQLKSTLGNGLADLVAKGIKFFAVDALAGTNGASEASVITQSLPGITDADLTSVVDGVKSQLSKEGATLVSTATIPLAGHQAMQVKLRLSIVNSKGVKVTVPATLDLLAANDQVYSLNLTGSSPSFAAIEQTFSLS